jgi:uncharacterized alkaline shock family protein YloU
MSEPIRPPGQTTIAPDVLVTIAKLTTLSVEGVARMATVSPTGVNKWFKRGLSDGVDISVENNIVSADLHVILHRNVNVRDVSHTIQSQVSRAISEMVGMEVGLINIHIEDIDYSREMAA